MDGQIRNYFYLQMTWTILACKIRTSHKDTILYLYYNLCASLNLIYKNIDEKKIIKNEMKSSPTTHSNFKSIILCK